MHRLLNTGHPEVVDADLSDYFGQIPHSDLLRSIARRVSDGRLLGWVKAWLEMAVEENDSHGGRRLTNRARRERKGTPQGSLAAAVEALGAAVDWIVSLTRGDTPTARRLQPSGRWPVDPVEIRWQRGVGYEVVADAGEAEPSNRQQSAEPIDERVLLHLLELDPDARQSARVLAAGLRCQGRRYNELSETLHRLVADEFVDHDQRPGTTNSRDRGYALTQEGRLRAASLRAAADSRVCAKNTEEAATVSEPGPPGMAGNGNATATPAEVREGQSGNAEADDIADGRRHENLRERRAGDGVPEDGRGRRGARARGPRVGTTATTS